MAALFWNRERRRISSASSGVGELKFVISNLLRDAGFQNVKITDLDVSGFKGDTLSSIAHCPIGPGEFWEVVMTGGGTGDARAVNQEIVRLLDRITSL